MPATAVGGYDEAIEKEGENEDCNEATDPERAVVGVSERTFGPREWGRRLLASCFFFFRRTGFFFVCALSLPNTLRELKILRFLFSKVRHFGRMLQVAF